MQVICEKCESSISYEGTPPKFCSECGSSLTGNSNLSQQTQDHQSNQAPADTREDSGRLIGIDSRADVTLPPESKGTDLKTQDGFGEGDKIGPYQLKRKLGQGGMGSVFEAVHDSTGQQVALKLLTSGAVSSNEESVQRFKRESQIAASINHPRSTFVYESGQHDDQIYITMELMPGGTLQDVVDAEGAQPVNKAVDYVLDMIEGLQVAHEAGIVHRDIKPSNSFVDEDGRIKVGDFGLAKSLVGDSSLTRTGMFMGTPQFAAPEQIKSGDIDERTDIYALGGTLFYLLAGRAPFTGNAAQVIASIASDTPPKVSEFASGVPKALTKLIDQTLAKDPAKRPYNLHVLRELLLPYSASGAFTADIGRRMAAYFLDLVAAATSGGMVAGLFWPILFMMLESVNVHVSEYIVSAIIQIPFLIFYFAIFESVLGTTPGKWLFGTRVIDEDGEIPKFRRSLIRALIFPGIPMCGSMLISGYLMAGAKLDDMQEVMMLMMETQALSLLSWLSVFAILYPARKSNGYRGYHGLFSGTRAVRLSGDVTAKPLDKFEITAPLKLSETEASAMNYEPYEIFGRFSKQDNSSTTVLLGKDPELDRQVWIFDNVQHGSINPIRKHLMRPHRLRVIHLEQNNGKTWYCTESSPGLPLIDVVDRKPSTWQSVRPILRDLAHELDNAQEQNLLPQNLGLSHAWIDHTGRVRLLDHTVVPNSTLTQESLDPVTLMLKIIDQVFESHAYPMHAVEFRNELAARKDEAGILDWAGDHLADMAEHPSTWNWDDRVGMYAITAGIEVSLLTAILYSIGFVMTMLFKAPIGMAVTVAITGGLAVAGLLAFFTKGGIAARASDVLVCNQSSFRPASRIHCALRAVVGWIPWLGFSAAFLFFMLQEASLEGLEGGLRTVKVGTGLPPSEVSGSDYSWVLWFMLASTLVTFGGMLLAVLNPARGIHDVLAHTRLIKK